MDRRLYSLAVAMIVLTACLSDFGSALPAGEGGVPNLLSTGTVRVGGGPVDGATVRLDRPLMGGGVTLDQTVTDSIGAYRFIITGNRSELCTIIVFEISLVAELQDGRQILHRLVEAVPPDCAESLTLGQSVTIVIDFDFPAPN